MAVSTSDFKQDLLRGKAAEALIYNYLTSTGIECENVSDVRKFWYDGDIKINIDGKEVFLDVKLDNRIADTGNFFLEECCKSFVTHYEWNGDLSKNYDYVAVVSPQDRLIYFLDWKICQKKAYRGKYKEIYHDKEMSRGYLVDIYTMKKEWKALLKIVEY